MDPLIIVPLLCGGSILAKNQFGAEDSKVPNYGVLTPARNNLFKAAMRSAKGPDALEGLAKQYDAAGLSLQASFLRKRAASQRLSPEQMQARKDVIAKVFKSKDPDQVRRFADAAEGEGMLRLAGRARHYAKLLDKASAASIPIAAPASQPASSALSTTHGESE